jgi:hypothetical protein
MAAIVGILPVLVPVGPVATPASASDPCAQSSTGSATAVVTAQLVTIGAQTYCVVDFTSSDNATTATHAWAVPAAVTSIEHMTIGGGGGGGGARFYATTAEWFAASGAGGGAGGYVTGPPLSVAQSTTLNITVGSGGDGGTGSASFPSRGTLGGNSSIQT